MLPASNPRAKKAGLAYWAHRVLAECEKAGDGFAADPVHDLRVAIRRCRSMADGFLTVDPDPAWKQMKRLAKPLFSSLGDLRDVQVMSEWVAKLSQPGDLLRESLLISLARREAELKAAAQNALAGFDRKRWASLNAHLAKRTGRVPLEGPVFQHLALERWLEARERHRQALRNRTQVGYHQLRIGLKRFRYTVENFLPQRHERWAGDLRDLQDALGEIHDLDVLRTLIRTHTGIATEHRARWNGKIAEERQQRLDFYRQKALGNNSLWRVWRFDLPSGERLEQAALEKLRCWASFLDPDPAHSAHVTAMALQVYDELSHCGILTWQADCRRILQTAAMVHEVGRSKDSNGHGGHQKRAYRLISRFRPPLGWTEEEMRCVAAAVRFHRGPLPVPGGPWLREFSVKRRSELLPLIGILRLANALDDAHDQRIAGVVLERRDGIVELSAQGLQAISPGAECIARARYLLEATCRVGIIVRPLAARIAPRTARRQATS